MHQTMEFSFASSESGSSVLNGHFTSLFVNRRIRKFKSCSFTRYNCLYLCIRNWQIEEDDDDDDDDDDEIFSSEENSENL